MDALARSAGQLGHIIRRRRKALGLTQTDLAGLSGIRQELISRIETGHDGARLGTINSLLAALDLEMTVGPRSKSSAADILDAL
jgi:HTH-type transcriptional regulator/antitoxin HipB